ncbi:MAG: hypothetical protein IKD10_02920 [Lentisphaeria bacterium]|nr:hypothetical protein [Lentisphaeria bacterium]
MLKKLFVSAVAAGIVLICNAADVTVKAVPVKSEEIKLDGVLDETVWQTAGRYSKFTRLAHPETPAKEQTVFQVAASPDGVYFAFDISDKNIVDSLDKFDSDLTKFNDVIELFISADDPLPDDPNVRTARQLIFNFKGTRADGSYLAGVRDGNWTSDWQVAVKRSSKGVTAELFVPYYALDMVNAQNKNLRFNIGRENIVADGKKALSVWQSASSFMDMTKFAVLQLPVKDLERFQYQINNLELKTVPAENGTMQMLTGKISGRSEAVITLQAVARSNGKIASFNRGNIKVLKGSSTEFAIPLNVGKSGVYDVTLTGRSNGSKLFYTRKALFMQTTSFTLNIKYPIYRKSFYPDQKNKTLQVAVEYSIPPKMMKNVKTVLTITGNAGKVVATVKGDSGTVKNFAVDTSKFAPGDYKITVTSSGEEFASGTLSDSFTVVAPAKPGTSSVRLDDDRYLLVNGKPFFPRGFIGGQHREPHFFEGFQAAGFNTVQFYGLNWPSLEDIKIVLDKADKCNLKVFCYPYWGTSIGFTGFRDLKQSNKYRNPRLTDAQWERLKKMVALLKEHPAFLGWYLADEPRGAELCDELRKVYDYLKKNDPHHPVITLDFTSGGCIAKKDLADIHILDMYPHPFKDGSWARSISSVLYSMKQVNENIGNAGAWFCPEAFTPRGKKYRPMTYHELRCLVFGTFINGATAMVPYKIGSTSQQYYIHGKNSGIFYTPEMRLGYLEGLGPELNALDGVLTSPVKLPAKTNAAEIIILRKKYQDKEYIFAVNSSDKTIKCTITATGMKADKLQVFSENRTVKMQKSSLTDIFEPYATHIYTDNMKFKSPVDVAKLKEKIRQTDIEARAKLNKKN